jgi:hypothetical protein
MKIAILYSGYPQYLHSCFDNHKKNIFTFFENNCEGLDLFGHFWKTESSLEEFLDDYRFINDEGIFTDYKVQNQESQKIINYKNYKADNYFPIHIGNTLSQVFSWKESWKIMNAYEEKMKNKYDLVMRIRPDEYFNSQLSLSSKISMNTLYFKDEFIHLNFGLNDHFAFGNRDLMFEFMNLYENIYDLIDKGCPVNLELLLGFQLRIIKNIDIQKIKIDFDLYRRIFI